MENVGNNLPQELVEEILSRLPCKSLIRFKCVCKHWYALVHHDTKFLSHHFSHFIKNQNSVATDDALLKLSFYSYPKTGMLTEGSKLFSLSATSHMHGMETPIPTFKSDSKLLEICGHSNGILCLSSIIDDHNAHVQVLLYNPVTTEVRHLPAEPLESDSLSVAVGMGYDSSISDFKVIRIQRRRKTTVTWAEQYTLSTDSWTVLANTKVELFQFSHRSFAMCFKRTFYWWAWSFEDYFNVILALNMDDGVYQIVPKPLGVYIGSCYARSLTVWNDSISLICCTTSNIDIWVMAGFGSWSLMRTIKHLTIVEPKPWVFWKGNNELLMEVGSCGEFMSYNVQTEEIKDVPIKKHQYEYNSCQVVNYVASLVPLK